MLTAVFENAELLKPYLAKIRPKIAQHSYNAPLTDALPLMSDQYEVIVITPNSRVKQNILSRNLSMKMRHLS